MINRIGLVFAAASLPPFAMEGMWAEFVIALLLAGANLYFVVTE